MFKATDWTHLHKERVFLEQRLWCSPLYEDHGLMASNFSLPPQPLTFPSGPEEEGKQVGRGCEENLAQLGWATCG